MQSWGTIGRMRALVVLVALAAGLALAGASFAGSLASWRLHQLDQDRCWDATTMDADLNGYTEDIRYDADNDCRWDTRVWNSVGRDFFLESMTFDMNEDGRWEYWLADNDQQEGWDVAYFDDNADGAYDRWSYIPKAPTSSLLEAIQGASFVGGTPTRSGAMGLVTYLARFTGGAAWAAPDYDSDGWPDHQDPWPNNRYRHP